MQQQRLRGPPIRKQMSLNAGISEIILGIVVIVIVVILGGVGPGGRTGWSRAGEDISDAFGIKEDEATGTYVVRLTAWLGRRLTVRQWKGSIIRTEARSDGTLKFGVALISSRCATMKKNLRGGREYGNLREHPFEALR
jgi:hypothetical protein